MNKIFNYSLYVFLLLILATSCREAMKLKSSVRKTQSQMRIVNTSVNRLKRSVGLNDKKNKGQEKEEESTDYLTIKQKNMLNNYASIFDFLNKGDKQIKSNNFTWDSIQNVYYLKGKKFG